MSTESGWQEFFFQFRVFAQTFELVRVFENQDNDNEEDNPIQTDLDDEDQFDWLWSPLCDFPVHVSLACIQVRLN